jgi:sugar lactone lactonase YvrE
MYIDLAEFTLKFLKFSNEKILEGIMKRLCTVLMIVSMGVLFGCSGGGGGASSSSVNNGKQLGEIITVAGGGVGDNGVATSSSLNGPSGVAVDSAGNIYIAETGSNCIRKVAAGTGIITTVAGNGTYGHSGDNGTATSAGLQGPSGVAVDSAGNIYIADTGSNRIRKVTAGTGIITTVAGNGTHDYSGDNGAATSASLAWPYGVAVDSTGNIYIADYGSNRIRKVTAGTGIITTVAGFGTIGYFGDNGPATSASLDYARGVAVDNAGNIYIADNENNRIRKVTAETGIITTVAGNGTQGYSGDNGPATSASLFQPDSMVVDSAGNIYIADSENNRIRMVAAGTGIITTVAGNGSFTYSGDNGAATSASLFLPSGVAVDSAGNIYIADFGNNRIREVIMGN